MSVEIKNRFTGQTICTGETIRDAVIRNLKSLRDAYLRGAYLRGAYLRDAYLGGADLRDADLGGAYLRGANLGGGESRPKVAWSSHDLIAEILRRAADDPLSGWALDAPDVLRQMAAASPPAEQAEGGR